MMDFSFIRPRYVEQLHDGVLLLSATEYRDAARILRQVRSRDGRQLHTQLVQAAELLEQELAQRAQALALQQRRPVRPQPNDRSPNQSIL